MLAWYHEDGSRHLCDVEACEAPADAYASLASDEDEMVWHFCKPHLRIELLAIDDHMKVGHPTHYHLAL